MNNTTNKYTRIDAWETKLTEEQQWQLYYKTNESGPWTDAAQWAVKEFGLEKMPSQGAFYRWLKNMRKKDQDIRIEEVKTAVAKAKDLAKYAPTEEELYKLCTALGMDELMSNHDVKRARENLKMAIMVIRIIQIKKETEILTRRGENLCKKEKLENEKRELWIKEHTPTPRSNLTPEERERKIKEIFGIVDEV